MTPAQGWMGLFNGFAGEDGSKGDSRDLLPYPVAARTDSFPRTFSKDTVAIIVNLIADGSISGMAAIAFKSAAEIKEQLNGE